MRISSANRTIKVSTNTTFKSVPELELVLASFEKMIVLLEILPLPDRMELFLGFLMGLMLKGIVRYL